MIRTRSGLRAVLATLLLGIAVGGASAQTAALPRVSDTTLTLPDGSVIRYGISVPDGDAAAGGPRPLVVALHPGGRSAYYGSSFMQSIVEPALRSWGAVIVAPDVPDRSWETNRSEAVVLALIEHVSAEHAIDRDRVLVTGFSMGGRGTWHMAARHPEVFTGAVVMAGTPDASDIEAMTSMPLYLIHSPDDGVVPFAPVEEAYLALAARGHAIEMSVLPGVDHYMMGAYVPALRAAGSWMLARWAAR
jgi:predicted peptidase